MPGDHRAIVAWIGRVIQSFLSASLEGGETVGLKARLLDETGRVVDERRLKLKGNRQCGTFLPKQAGAYRVEVAGISTADSEESPVTASVLVWPGEATP